MSTVYSSRPHIRSAEQAARVLLSNAFRYDTWESQCARRQFESAGEQNVHTFVLSTNRLTSEVLGIHFSSVNFVIFDTKEQKFVGASYTCKEDDLREPLVFQATSWQTLIIELCVRQINCNEWNMYPGNVKNQSYDKDDENTSELIVTHFAVVPIASLCATSTFLPKLTKVNSEGNNNVSNKSKNESHAASIDNTISTLTLYSASAINASTSELNSKSKQEEEEQLLLEHDQQVYNNSVILSFRPGSAELMLLPQSIWPKESVPSVITSSSSSSQSNKRAKNKVNKGEWKMYYSVDHNKMLFMLLRELVPPNTFVQESFTQVVPHAEVNYFRVVIPDITLSPRSEEFANMIASNTSNGGGDGKWSIAAMAHNGYQQLGEGVEVELKLLSSPRERPSRHTPLRSSSSSSSSYSSYSQEYEEEEEYSSITSIGEKEGKQEVNKDKSNSRNNIKENKPMLCAVQSIKLNHLPIHSSTSLVLAIRHQSTSHDAGSSSSSSNNVMGFCVMPLCVLPMRNREIRVEHLPAIRGPFSCNDTRLLHLDLHAPYKAIPLSLTMTLHYHGIHFSSSSSPLLQIPPPQQVEEKENNGQLSVKSHASIQEANSFPFAHTLIHIPLHAASNEKEIQEVSTIAQNLPQPIVTTVNDKKEEEEEDAKENIESKSKKKKRSHHRHHHHRRGSSKTIDTSRSGSSAHTSAFTPIEKALPSSEHIEKQTKPVITPIPQPITTIPTSTTEAAAHDKNNEEEQLEGKRKHGRHHHPHHHHRPNHSPSSSPTSTLSSSHKDSKLEGRDSSKQAASMIDTHNKHIKPFTSSLRELKQTQQPESLPSTLSPATSVAYNKEEGNHIFAFLNTIMSELRQIRDTQLTLMQQTKQVEPGLFQEGHTHGPSNELDYEKANACLDDVKSPSSRELIHLLPRSIGVSWKAKIQIRSHVQPLLHPIHGTVLSETHPAVGELPHELFGICFEGISLDTSSDSAVTLHMPHELCVMFSFGALPLQQVGPLQTESVEKNHMYESCKVYSEARNGTGSGFVWCEPVESIRSLSMIKYKELVNNINCNNNNVPIVYLHVFDALTMFYIASANLPLSQFQRPSHSECGLHSLDLSLQRDLGMTSQLTPQNVLPLARDVGQLHLTVFCVGISAELAPRGITHSIITPEDRLINNNNYSTINPCNRIQFNNNTKRFYDTNNMNGVVGRYQGRSFIVAQRLPNADQLLNNVKNESKDKMSNTHDKAISAENNALQMENKRNGFQNGKHTHKDKRKHSHHHHKHRHDKEKEKEQKSQEEYSKGVNEEHQKRVRYFKEEITSNYALGGAAHAAGVPLEHLAAAQANHVFPSTSDDNNKWDMEYKLRLLEKERQARKARLIARTLLDRMTIECRVFVSAWRPEVVTVSFANPYHTPMQFFMEVSKPQRDVCEILTQPSFFLAPHAQTMLQLLVKNFNVYSTQDHVINNNSITNDYYITNNNSSINNNSKISLIGVDHSDGVNTGKDNSSKSELIKACVYTSKRELVRAIHIHSHVGPPIIDRRYEIYGAAGSSVHKRILSRLFSSCAFPLHGNESALLQKLHSLCAFIQVSHAEFTSASSHAMLDPLTQDYITAWEEIDISTTIPVSRGEQRLEYITLFKDAACSCVLETWELCVFACETLTSRELEWGQTSTLTFPVNASEEMYCDDNHGVQLTRQTNTANNNGVNSYYLLRIKPREVGMQSMLLHTLRDDGALKKTLLTIHTIYPNPTFTQVMQFSVAEMNTGPLLRRLRFVNKLNYEETFTVHSNYKFHLRLGPTSFTLAPNESQYVALQFSGLQLPEGQLEGRWPMWIFINSSEDKTVESYLLQVVLRVNPVIAEGEKLT